MYKFRSMRKNADEVKEELRPTEKRKQIEK